MRVLGEFEAVMQTRDEVEAFKNKETAHSLQLYSVYVINAKSHTILDYLTQWFL